MAEQIVPRNLTARATYQVAGNPSVTRPEDSVANCYPGLELDVRNFDRRFFPGLVFDFVARDDVDADYSHPQIYGARLRYLDYMTDPDLIDHPPPEDDRSEAVKDWARRWKLYNDLQGKPGSTITEGVWYIDWIEQAGKRLSMTRRDEHGHTQPMDGLFVWRLVRSLEYDSLRMGLGRRDLDSKPPEVVIEGWRRQFVDPETGVLNGAFQPGELMQSLCSPWQHDFRDCACHYWAANHPDVVYGRIRPGERVLPDQAPADPERANTLLDWLRRDRTPGMEAAAENTIEQNRPYQFDHFEINQHWERLNIVLDDTEIDSLYVPVEGEHARPFDSPEQLATALRENLAPLEMALAIEYLYARFSLLSRDEALAQKGPTLADDVTFVRHYILLTAVSEMQHLRWANQLLWELYDARLIPSYEPVLQPAKWIPAATSKSRSGSAGAGQVVRQPAMGLAEASATFKVQQGQTSAAGGRWRERSLRPLTPAALADFIAVEHPSGDIDLNYSRVVATLKLKDEYPDHMAEIAERIVKDGMDHFSRFRDIQGVLSTSYRKDDPPPYLRHIRIGSEGETKEALDLFDRIVANLKAAYADEAQGAHDRSSPHITAARDEMNRLLDVGEKLAAGGIGIPFWQD
jgi:hypothetical protein